MRLFRVCLTVFVLAILRAAPAEPCCMVPADYKGTIGQSAQEAVMFHHDGREELVLRINYKIQGDAMPDRFAWIITVPSEPDSYAVTDGKLFEEMFDWAEEHARRKTLGYRKGDAQQSNSHGLEFGKAVKVGPYDIQPVRALGKEALEGLNQWLERNGFPTEDPKHMEYFVEKKFTFLCIQVVPGEGAKAVESAGGVPPLQLSFRSENPYYPLRFSSRQGVFDVNLYVLTRKSFDFEASGESLKKINWSEGVYDRNVEVKVDSFPKTLKAVYERGAFKAYDGKWFVNVLQTRRVNEGNTIATWKEDIFFRTKA